MTDQDRPAFYAASSGGLRDLWTILHPPYTVWHLSYVVIGATLAPVFDLRILAATMLAFFLAVGIGAHALDELNSRPLSTKIPNAVLAGASFVSVTGAVAIGVIGVAHGRPALVAFILFGAFIVVAYNMEMLKGRFHNDFMFAFAWGAFPLLTSYFAQANKLDVIAVVAALAAFALSSAQRTLSTPARRLRRKTARVEGSITLEDGTVELIDKAVMLKPLEGALRSLSLMVPSIAMALLGFRLVNG